MNFEIIISGQLIFAKILTLMTLKIKAERFQRVTDPFTLIGSESKMSANEIKKMLRDNIAVAYTSESNKNIQTIKGNYNSNFAKDKISSTSKAQSVNTTKRSIYSARQRSVKERPKTSKITATSPRILIHTNRISRNVLSK